MNFKVKAIAGIAVLLFQLGSSRFAEAQPADSLVALYSGGTITWNGVANQFTAASGNAMINDVREVHIAGANWATKGAGADAIFCNDVPGNAQGKNAVYYVYYAAYPNGAATNYTHVISATPPFAEGYPDKSLTFTVPTFPATTTQAAVFVGSYLTDNKGDMIPFERMGERVVLAPALGGGLPFARAVFNLAFNGVVVTQALSLQIPASASALLVDFDVSGAGAADMFVLDPTFNAGGCPNPPMQADLYMSVGSRVQYSQLRVKNLPTSGNVTIQLCSPGAHVVNADYVGYVEPFPHLY